MSWFKNVNKERESKNAKDENWENLKFPIDLRFIITLIELLKNQLFESETVLTISLIDGITLDTMTKEAIFSQISMAKS